jgi:hypothetical protein
MILRACWPEENDGIQAARPWLRWFLARVLGIKGRPVRESCARRKQQWLAIRKEAGLKIDPETAEVFWTWGQIVDPYGLGDLTDEERCIGRNYFARSPGSEMWVSFDEPDAVRHRLWARLKADDFDDDDLTWRPDADGARTAKHRRLHRSAAPRANSHARAQHRAARIHGGAPCAAPNATSRAKASRPGQSYRAVQVQHRGASSCTSSLRPPSRPSGCGLPRRPRR